MPAVTVQQAFELAFQHHQAGRLADAEALYRQVLTVQPNHADALHFLGVIAHQAGRPDLAVDLIRQAIALNPNNPGAQCNFGAALAAQGKADDAIAAFRRALQLKPDYPDAHNNLGTALAGQGRPDDAIAAYRQAIQFNPADLRAHNNLGLVLRKEGRLGQAVAAFRRALELQPGYPDTHRNLGTALAGQGRLDEAVACYRHALRLQPDSFRIHSTFLAVLHYCPQTTLPGLLEAHTEYHCRHAAPLAAAWRPHQNGPEPSRQIRLGFISPHFGSHPVGSFLIRLLENLDRTQFRVIGYSDTPAADHMTARIQAAMRVWRNVSGMSDEQLAGQIREDRVDILFDLAGHTAENRLQVFARRPAPIQITWLDYVGTTGLEAIDYILADPRQIPPAAEPYYCEKVLRMPDDYICYDPPVNAPLVGPLPALANGHVTFASFNIPPKTTPQMVRIWARILESIPRARMILKNRGFDDPETCVRYRELFAADGIAADRVEMRGWSPPHDVLASYREVDIALDTFPYNGGLTTCESIWMGVPVVTCPGEIFASRHGIAHLTAAGVPETVACDLDHYVEIAVKLASDLPELAAWRSGSRQRVAASPLCDGKRYAAHFAALLRDVWQRWCATQEG
ncbi:MAG: tetratricopeptide repeat protein [Chthoniobacter sp.]|uniref:O-linked N-acetylglucosamine transferase, SPINDLY family protein n=1 Tax=Chthoniobacter sp. TaxID=2510640 RepID=UPI0032AD40E1